MFSFLCSCKSSLTLTSSGIAWKCMRGCETVLAIQEVLRDDITATMTVACYVVNIVFNLFASTQLKSPSVR